MLGHHLLGTGDRRIVVLHDWLCDTSTWDAAEPYLDTRTFCWAFADLRGYGRSRGQRGEHTVVEAATDVLSLVNALGWSRCTLVGHSMSTLVALHLAQQASAGSSSPFDRLVLLTPPPPAGFGADTATLEAMRAVANGDDVARMRLLRRLLGDRLSDGFLRFKLDRWRATSDVGAVAGYVAAFARDGAPDPKAHVSIPVLAVTGEEDSEPMRRDAVTASLAPICPRLEVRALAGVGHYPMQEAPPLLVAIVERFAAGPTPPGGPVTSS